MGSLANWGAIAGLGKGIEKNADTAQKGQDAAREEAKERRMAALQAQYQQESQNRGFEQQGKMAGVEQTNRKEIVGLESENANKLADKKAATDEKSQGREFEFKGSEGDKDRANKKDIAQTRANATSANKNAAALAKRWESKVVKTTDMSNPRMPVEKDALALFDKQTGRSYNQEGDKFYLQGGKPDQVKTAARSEISKLISNPDQADNFLRVYKYLPVEFFSNLSISGDTGSDETANDE